MKRSVRKFPVIAPDGRKYLVKIDEEYSEFFGQVARVYVYSRGLSTIWIPYQEYNHVFCPNRLPDQLDRLYDPDSPNYIRLATETIRKMHREYGITEESSEAKRKLREWDGRVYNEEESK